MNQEFLLDTLFSDEFKNSLNSVLEMLKEFAEMARETITQMLKEFIQILKEVINEVVKIYYLTNDSHNLQIYETKYLPNAPPGIFEKLELRFILLQIKYRPYICTIIQTIISNEFYSYVREFIIFLLQVLGVL